MKHFQPWLYGKAYAAATVTGHAQTSPLPAPVQRFTHGLFEDVPVHRPAGAAQQFALLVEGKAAPEAEQALRRSMLARGAVVAEWTRPTTVDLRCQCTAGLLGAADAVGGVAEQHNAPAGQWQVGQHPREGLGCGLHGRCVGSVNAAITPMGSWTPMCCTSGACGHLAAVDARPFRGVPFKDAGQALYLDPGFRQGLTEFQCDGMRHVVPAFAQQAAAWRTMTASSAVHEWPSR